VDTETKKAIEECLKNVDHQTAACWAAICTEHVMPYFEQTYPQDNRPKQAITAIHAWLKGDIRVGEARKAAFTA
jgi:hypothetical protein